MLSFLTMFKSKFVLELSRITFVHIIVLAPVLWDSYE